jgi:hypothetical protein
MTFSDSSGVLKQLLKITIPMHKTFFVFATFSLALAFTAIACGEDDGGDGTDYASQADCSSLPAAATSYELVVKPILDVSCAVGGCHDATTAAEGIDLSDYASSKNAFDKKDALCSIHHGSGCEPMPVGGKLDDLDINKLDCWVKNDFPE